MQLSVCVGRDPKIGAPHQTLTQADAAFNNAVQYNVVPTNEGPIMRLPITWFPLTRIPLTGFPLPRFSLNVAEFMCVKFVFSKKASKIEEIFTVDLTLTT